MSDELYGITEVKYLSMALTTTVDWDGGIYSVGVIVIFCRKLN